VGGGRHRVVNVDKLTYAGSVTTLEAVLDSPDHLLVQADICDSDALEDVFRRHRPEAVLHLAAESHVDRSIDGPAAFIETNIVGTYRLLEASLSYWRTLQGRTRDSFRFVHVSTDEVYGSAPPSETFDEASPYRPNSPYAASKAASDHLGRSWHRTYGLPVIVTNCTNNYGPYQFPEKLIPLMTLAAIDGRSLPIYGDGLHVRDWIHVEDHCVALASVLVRGRPGEVYNIGGGAQRTNLEVVQAICDCLDRLRPRTDGRSYGEQMAFVADRPGHDRRYALHSHKIERELHWRAQIGFHAGLTNTIEWYLSHQSWCERVASRYDGGRLGLRA
jgi:dTDP-glucose 4,6-dehydratase